MTPDPTAAPRARRLWALGGMGLALLGALAWAALAPEERSLGDRIRAVYLHVSATWAGVGVLYATGLAGVAVTLRPAPRVEAWLRRIWLAGLATFAVGFLVSLVAARSSWGGVFWAEPRVRASLGVVAVGLVALTVDSGLPRFRARGLTWTLAAAAAFVVLRTAALFVHPDHPLQRTSPAGIKAAFFGITALFLTSAAFLAVALPAPDSARSQTSSTVELP